MDTFRRREMVSSEEDDKATVEWQNHLAFSILACHAHDKVLRQDPPLRLF